MPGPEDMAHTDRNQRYWPQRLLSQTPAAQQPLPESSTPQTDPRDSRPIAPESPAARETASGYRAESVVSNPAPTIRLLPYRVPKQMQGRLRPQRPDSREQVSKPVSLIVAPRLGTRKRLCAAPPWP